MFDYSMEQNLPLRSERELERKGRLSLGRYTSIVSPYDENAKNRRLIRFVVQNVIAKILPMQRISNCLRLIVPGKDFVTILYSEKVKRAHYGNLTVCGSVWACPVCAAKITERRRIDLAGSLDRWQGGVVLGAFTLQHTRQDSLLDMRQMMTKSYRKMQSGKAWISLKKRWGIVGTITGSEVTWGQDNGWHYHKHNLTFTESAITANQVQECQEEISLRFRHYLSEMGGYAHPEIGVKFTLGESDQQKNYVCKWGLDFEMTKGPVKKAIGGYSPFELAAWAANGDPLPASLFREYYWGMKGSNQLNYSKGLRKLLAMGTDISDQELAQLQQHDDIELACIARNFWAHICQTGRRGELLEVASSGDIIQLDAFLEGL
jgi:hypothetical protein